MSEDAGSTPSVTAPLSPGKLRLFRLIMLSGLLVFAVAAVIGAEVAARYYERHRTTPPDYFPSVYYPHRRLRYGLTPNRDYFGWFRINSLGFRGKEISAEKKPGVIRVVCLGGSTTFDIASVGSAPPWPEVLETELRRRFPNQQIEVLNLGIPGATSLDSLIDLQTRALPLHPDLVILYQSHNDLTYSIPPARPQPTGLYPLEDRPRSSFVRWLTYHSLLYAKAEDRVIGPVSGIVDSVFGLFGGGNEGVAEDRGQAMEHGLADFRSNVMSIAAIAQANRLALALVQVTVPFPVDGQPKGSCQMCEALSQTYGNVDLATLKSMYARYDRVLKQSAEGTNVYFIPSSGFVPSADRYYHDPVHFSPDGSRELGVKLGEALAPIVTRLRSAEPDGAAPAATQSASSVALAALAR